MTNSPQSTSTARWLGPVCGFAAAVLYTLTNIALRDCIQVDPYLVSAVKATPTVLLLGPFLIMVAVKGGRVLESRQKLPQFLVASFMAQVIGNAGFQKSLGHIGLAAAVPITLGTLIVGGAILGILLLKEHVGQRKTIAMVTLIAAVIVLSLPPGTPETTSTTASKPLTTVDVLLGSFWAAVSGLSYSFFGVSLRQMLQTGVRPSTTMFVSGTVGFITLWTYSLALLPREELAATTSRAWVSMTTAGILNFAAFIAITVSLRLLPVVAVNLINASQVAMAAIAGVLLFEEAFTRPLMLGILLTLSGLVLLASPETSRRRTEATEFLTASPPQEGDQIN
ncbi:MAG: DMT family transporter [Planctomycetota bacterium]